MNKTLLKKYKYLETLYRLKVPEEYDVIDFHHNYYHEHFEKIDDESCKYFTEHLMRESMGGDKGIHILADGDSLRS